MDSNKECDMKIINILYDVVIDDYKSDIIVIRNDRKI